jgi:hypothetical protein
MGQEILYCSACATQLRSADFEKGKAHRSEAEILCRVCYQARYDAPPPRIEEPAPPTSNTPSRGTNKSKSRSTGRIPIVAAPPPAESAPDPSGNTTLWVSGGGILLVLLVLVGLAQSGSRPTVSSRTAGPFPEPDRQLRSTPDPGPAPRVVPKDPEDRGARELPSARSAERREETARASLRKAIEFEGKQPEDFEGTAALYEQALWDAKDTPVFLDARTRMDALRARQRQAYVAELVPVGERIRGLLEKELYGSAIEALETAKSTKAAPSWRALVDERLDDVRTKASRAFLTLKEKALAAHKQGRPEEVNAITAKVAAWGLASISKDLQDALSGVALPAPTPAADPRAAAAAVEAFRSAWAAAMAPCAGRDFAEAAKAMDGAAAGVQDKDLRAEASADAELLRKAAALVAEAGDVLAKWPKGKELVVSCWDPSGARRDVKGSVTRADAFRVAIVRDKEVVSVEQGEVLGSWLADFLSRRPGRNLAADGPALALICLSEGDVDAARKLAPTLPAKYLSWGEGLRAGLAAPEAVQAENDARALFYAAERDAGTFASQAQGVTKARSLLADFAKTRFVRRNRASIGARAEEARDYVFLGDDLTGWGSFKATRAKTGLVWTSDADSDGSQRKNNFVDLDFSALQDLHYRCWVYIGGCCAETMAFVVQGTEMKAGDPSQPDAPFAEPGGDIAGAVRHSIAASTKTHASHGGRKQPTHWGWVEVPLPAYTSAGAKKVRIVTDQQGFSVGAAVVSATRSAAPSEAEMRALERARGSRPALVPGALTASIDRAEGGYDLTRQGPLDWAYWGRGKNLAAFDHKATGGGQISKAVETGRGVRSGTFAADSRTVAWADGAPTATGASEHAYIWSNGALNTGFSFSCAAGPTRHTLLIYCGASNATGTLSVSLSDNSAPPCVVTFDGPGTFLVAINFNSGSANQTLRLSLLKTGNHTGFTDGSVDLMAAMLR